MCMSSGFLKCLLLMYIELWEIFGWHPKKIWRKESFCFNYRGWGTFENSTGKVLTIALCVSVIQFSFLIFWPKIDFHSHCISHLDFILQFAGSCSFPFLLPCSCNCFLISLEIFPPFSLGILFFCSELGILDSRPSATNLCFVSVSRAFRITHKANFKVLSFH